MNIEKLRKAVQGTVWTRESADYQSVRSGLLWNGRKPDRFPEIVVRAMTTADVQAAVSFAAESGRRVVVRGGGHHFSAIALQDCLVIDLGGMNGLQVDPQARIAQAQPAVTNGMLATALSEHGLAFPTGHCASVPLSGYLLGGGIGWNAGAWGIACHNVQSVEVVLADGSRVVASETDNPDVFWAARGAGPEFFGVVTQYRLRLHDLPRAIRTSVWTYPISQVNRVEQWMSRTMQVVPRNVEFTAVFSSAPPPLAGQATKTISAIATVFAATEDEAQATLAQVAAGAPQDALDIQQSLETPLEVLYLMIGQFFPEGRRYAADTNWTADPARQMEIMAKAVVAAPSAESFAIGVVLPPPDGARMPQAAFSMVGPAFGCTYAVWGDARQDSANLAWMRTTSEKIAPISLGHYIGEADLDLDERLAGSFSREAFERLQHLQRTYDPSGLFHRLRSDMELLEKVG
ncbi:FAD linked oxidase-like [Pseudorhizobium banfieldiae]|uniref:FAD linked oxidase-like n=1 Tax=Pseudorhizobium banfieldiae TaxID=1125847 RepID=L0NB97_9HYPH|nr:FAD-binding oxidoreductase [Pseudorhizobium banfieldiae]CAD6602175.1 FAD binding domain-containing protein [arsenite-oxidising bacterium NT-25]CAD6606619.1 FAD binding domain-containing protein [Rhizobium sp. TCK]CCF18383.1 FAD linked oxidase-like [Pseudorhizobium banfieldiae]